MTYKPTATVPDASPSHGKGKDVYPHDIPRMTREEILRCTRYA